MVNDVNENDWRCKAKLRSAVIAKEIPTGTWFILKILISDCSDNGQPLQPQNQSCTLNKSLLKFADYILPTISIKGLLENDLV